MKKAVFYARVSSDIQAQERTIESQISELKKQIKNNGHELVKEYIDDGYSGAMLSRPAMDQLREDIKTDMFETIYFHNADRIARDVTYQNIIISEILHYKKQIIINGQDYVHNPENKFTLTVLGAVAELEKAKTLERCMRGRQYRLNQGYLMSSGCHIYGYTYIHRTPEAPAAYIINKEEAKIVQYIFRLYAKGEMSYRAIIRHLDKKKIPCRQGRVWNWAQMNVMLKNITYTGIKYFNTTTDTNALAKFEGRVKKIHRVPTDKSTWIGIKIPQIISQELFDKVQKRINYNRECYRNAKNTKLLSGLLFCSKCGGRCHACHRYYLVERKEGNRLYQRTNYRCSVKAGTIRHNPEINARIIEPGVFDMIRKYLIDPNKLKDCMDYFTKSSQFNQSEIEQKVQNLKNNIRTIQKQKKRIIDLYTLNKLDRETYTLRINVYEEEIRNLEKQIAELIKSIPVFSQPDEVLSSLDKYCQEVKRRLNKCDDIASKRKFLLDYVEKVEYLYVYGIDEIKVLGSVPVKLNKISGITRLGFILTDKINRIKSLEKIREDDTKNGLCNMVEVGKTKYMNIAIEKA
jgi:site-specific DNA recombinase